MEDEERPSTSRRSLTRNQVVNFMPSRQLPYNTLRHRRHNSEHNVLLDADEPDSNDKQADIIVREMELHQQLMEDNPVSEELRREALRDLPQGLTMKRHVRAKLSASVSLRSKRRPISWTKSLKYRISFAWKRFGERTRDAMFSIELWYEAIRNIEGQFGSAVGSYFRMVRRLFVVDAALATLALLLLALPQGIHDQRGNTTQHEGIGPGDWFTGTGGLSNSLLFYGHYHDGVLATTGAYNMPFAYFFTMLALYLVFFFVLCYRTAYSYRRHFIETAGGLSHIYASKVFCGWDFGIISEHAAKLHHNSIYNEMKELLSEQNRGETPTSFLTRAWRCLSNVCVTSLVLACIASVLYGVWVLVGVPALLHWELAVSAAITAVTALCPLLFHLLVKLEYYSARTAVYVTLGRTWLLDMSIIMLLFMYWAQSEAQCWETRFGQETYRLVMLDAVVSLLVLPAIEIFRALLYKMHGTGSGPEFNIAYNSLTLIYNQALVWAGLVFCPLLAAAVTLKFLLLFYVKRECALRACQPARKVWRAAQTQTVLYMLVTLSLFATLFAIGSVFLQMSSTQCGPFRSYGRVAEVVSVGVLSVEQRPALRVAASWLLRPAALGLYAVLLGVMVYFVRGKAVAQRATVALLRRMLVLQAKDKDFLLRAITRVHNGEWSYSPKSPREGPDSHTWRYLRDVRKPSNSSFHFDASRLSRSFASRPLSQHERGERAERSEHDGDTDSSFSWQGSGNELNKDNKNWL